MLHAIIMAGGSGTRFWPMSRAARPKQLLALAGERTMLQATVDRLEGLVPPERVLVVTGEALAAAVAGQLPQLPAEAILAEPCRRDTAPCIGLAALVVARRDPDATMVVLPADHVIRPDAAFRAAIRQAAALVEDAPQRFVTFGVRPTYPAETFGYIERGEALPPQVPAPALGAGSPYGERSAPAVASAAAPAFRVRRFREKPDAATAAGFVAAGTFYWNSGIFVWKASTIVEALRQRQPEMHARLVRIAESIGAPRHADVFREEFTAIRGISIDYAVMEHADDVAVIEAPFEWDDVGSWQAVRRLRGQDEQGNTVDGRHLGLETEGTIVRSEGGHLVVTLGVRDLIVVHTADVTLVADRRQEESIRRLVRLLEEKGQSAYL